MDTTFVPRGMEERLLYLLRYCISLPREEITVDFHKIETTTLRTPVARETVHTHRCSSFYRTRVSLFYISAEPI